MSDTHKRQTQRQRSRKSQDARKFRARVSRACIHCASPRKKCGDEHLCSRCQSKGLECTLEPQREALEQQDSNTSEHFQYCQAQEKATWEEAQRFQVANYANPQTNSLQPCVGVFQDAFPQFRFSDEVWIPSPNQSNLSASQNSELAAGSQNMLSLRINGYAYHSLTNPWAPSSF